MILEKAAKDEEFEAVRARMLKYQESHQSLNQLMLVMLLLFCIFVYLWGQGHGKHSESRRDAAPRPDNNACKSFWTHMT